MKNRTDILPPKRIYVSGSKKTGWVKVRLIPIEPVPVDDTRTDIREEDDDLCTENSM